MGIPVQIPQSMVIDTINSTLSYAHDHIQAWGTSAFGPNFNLSQVFKFVLFGVLFFEKTFLSSSFKQLFWDSLA